MKSCTYYFLVLDIETSTLKDKEGKPVATWLSYGYCNLYYRDGERIDTFYFRDWEKLSKYLTFIEQKFFNYKITCYAHNLAYEFDYMLKNLSKPTKILSNSTHSVIATTLDDFPQIEFRCSYQLSALSLRKIGLQFGFEKLESDYRFILPKDKVTEEEKEYCIRDCDIVAKYIADQLKEYGNIHKIPYTKTGRVRRKFKEFYSQYCTKDEKWDLMPDENCYEAMLDAFNGGAVFSNPYFTGKILKNVHSYDIASSYPYAMLKEKYPSVIKKIENPSINNLTGFFIAKIKFYDIQSKYPWQWLSNYKFNYIDGLTSVFFNGKLVESNEVVRTITNIDFDLINLTYTYEKIEVLEFYELSNVDYLPKPYIETIKYFSNKKFELKNKLKEIKIEYGELSQEYIDCDREYMQSKNDFNSIYGMAVQKLVQTEFEIDENYLWKEKNKKYVKTNKHLYRNFLFGIFITCYAKRNLILAIIKNCPYSFVYCDTDSIKFIGENKFIDTNEKLSGEFETIDSIKNLGKFEYECTYNLFITYGAKKYCYENENGVHTTVAGLPKIQKGNENYWVEYNGEYLDCLTEDTKQLKSIKYFKCGTIFHNCKLAKKYLNNNINIVIDEYDEELYREVVGSEIVQYLQKNKIKTNGGVALCETDYELNITKSDKCYLNELEGFFELWLTNINGIHLKEYLVTM